MYTYSWFHPNSYRHNCTITPDQITAATVNYYRQRIAFTVEV
ncbi:hypothetical protein [Bacillus coahuilensis]|nr:hypothetical protein [Bacillus coahuilensis]